MEQNKQIEEMAKDIYYAIRNECKLNTCGNCNDCEFNVPEKTNEIGCLSYLVGKILTQMNYRKIPECAVVLTEERNKIICDRFEQLERVQAELQELNAKYYNEAKDLRRELKQIRKETAREIITKMRELLDNVDQIYETHYAWETDYGYLTTDVDEGLKELAKQYNVEV